MAGENTQQTGTPPAGTPPATPPVAPPAEGHAPPAAPPSAGTLLGNTEAPKPPEGQAPAAPPAGAAAGELELKLPEGFDDKAPILGDYKAVAKELGLDSASAQKVFDVYTKAVTEAQAAQAAEFKSTPAQWLTDLKRDPEIGGAKWGETATSAALGLKRFGDPDLAKWIGDAGLADFPPLVKLFDRVNKLIADDSILPGRTAMTAPLLCPDAVHPPARIVDRAFVDAARGAGLRVHVWSVKTTQEAQRLLDLGVDGLIVDDVAAMKPLFG